MIFCIIFQFFKTFFFNSKINFALEMTFVCLVEGPLSKYVHIFFTVYKHNKEILFTVYKYTKKIVFIVFKYKKDKLFTVYKHTENKPFTMYKRTKKILLTVYKRTKGDTFYSVEV